MANEVSYLTDNVLMGFSEWSLIQGASIVDNKIRLTSGGYASVDLSDLYFLGLNSSRYRKLVMSLSTTILEIYNYRNIIEAVLEGVYVNNDEVEIPFKYNVSFTKLDNTIGTVSYQSREIPMLSYKLKSMKLLVINHSDYDVDLVSCEMYRSQDISTDQIGGAIGWGVVLNKVEAYLDGCKLYFDGAAEPTKLQWLCDEHEVFNGVKVNDERIISFSKVNSPLD
jgi:hypothetical protein